MDTARELIGALVLTIRGQMIEHELKSGGNWPDLHVGVAVPGPDDHPRLREAPARRWSGGPGKRTDHRSCSGKLRNSDAQLNATHRA
jgi:hypothetical protein